MHVVSIKMAKFEGCT